MVAVSDVVTVELRIRILAGIADVFDGLREKVDAAAAAAAAVLAGEANATAGAAAGQQRRAPGIDADAVRWAVGTSLSHVGKYMYCCACSRFGLFGVIALSFCCIILRSPVISHPPSYSSTFAFVTLHHICRHRPPGRSKSGQGRPATRQG